MLKNRKPPVASTSNTSSARPDASTVRHRTRPTVASPARGEETASADPEATSSIATGVPVTVATSAAVAVNDHWNGLPPASARKDPEDDPQTLYRHPFRDMRHLATVEDDDDPLAEVDPKNTTEPEGTTQLDRDTDDPAVPFVESKPVASALPEPQTPAVERQDSAWQDDEARRTRGRAGQIPTDGSLQSTGLPFAPSDPPTDFASKQSVSSMRAPLPDGGDDDRRDGRSGDDGATRPHEESSGDPGYKVGRGRPPKETQFKKGQSGNPKGRPKGARNSTTIVTELLNTRLASKVNGQPKKMLTREALFSQQLVKGLKGDLKSTAFLLQFDQPDGPSAVNAGPPAEAELSASERALFAHIMIEEYRSLGLTDEQIAGLLRRQGLDPDGEGQ